MAYPITKKHIKMNYSTGVNIIKDLWGMVLHCTATPGAQAINFFNNWGGNPNSKASAHAVIDDANILELLTVDPGQVDKGWHACATGNAHFAGVELCMPKKHDTVYFKNVWDRAVWYFAYKFITVLKQNKVAAPKYKNGYPVEKGNLMSHWEVTYLWHESTHVDPVAYFAEYGKTVNDFRAAVQQEIDRQTSAGMSIEEALDILANAYAPDGGKMINNPDLWKNAFRDKKINIEFVKSEFIRMAQYIKLNK